MKRLNAITKLLTGNNGPVKKTTQPVAPKLPKAKDALAKAKEKESLAIVQQFNQLMMMFGDS